MTGVVLFAGGGLACHGLEEAGLDLAWALWGGDAALTWSARVVRAFENAR